MKYHTLKILVKEPNINFHNWYTTALGFNHPIFKKIVGAILPCWIAKIENDYGEWGVVEEQWQKIGELFAKRMAAGKIDIFDVEKKHYWVGEKIWGLTDFVYKKDLAQVSTARLLATLKQMWELYHYLNGIGYVAVVSDFEHGFLTGQLTKILLEKKVPPEKIGIYQNLLTGPNKETLFWCEQLDLLAICFKNKNLKQLSVSKDLIGHCQKYFWLNYGFQGPVWTREDFLNRAKEVYQDKNIGQKISLHKNNFKILISEQKILNKKLGITKKEDYYFETARLFTFLKGYRIEIRHRYSYALDKIFIELGKRLYLPLNFFRYATKEEITKTVTGHLVPQKDILKRKQKMLFILDKFTGRFVKFDQIDKIFKKLLIQEKIKFTGSVSGQAVCIGKVRGRVKILHNVKDVGKVKRGDILVTFATTPDFLPAMVRAAAYVTDQGGITSHAAITAREMKKPCIIGTKIATKIFKDGDLVEVDAEHGLVRKIK